MLSNPDTECIGANTETNKVTRPVFHAQAIFRLGSETREGRELLLRNYAGYSLAEILKKPELFITLMPGLFNTKIDCIKGICPSEGKKIFINLTPGQIKSPHLEECITRLLEVASPEFKIVLEVTENEVVDDWNYTLRTLHGLQERGIEIAIDDFGAGYANLKSLIQIRPTYVKVDRLILDKACIQPQAENFVYALVNFIHNLEMKAILEGIETAKHLAIAIKSRAEFGQGYLFEKPKAIVLP
ncbi:EAL domain-containing protein [Aliidiomarina quisquiliarum]|uniref:EAL domain-containing protein n=1 Tax=Aliidiomarina quisquiliarum TaxID=2938947 RepID=UPI00208F11A9|nr:EAL domain-containing protein [Aliidiomarina quisquiliarum]MCO4320363.1 EAL domain-containing protein [Aliidiomarina quisquiliarum]